MAKTILAKTIMTADDPSVDDPSYQFVFHSDTATDYANIGALFTALDQFLNTANTYATMASYVSNVISRGSNAVNLELYDITTHLDGTPHGSPVGLSTTTLGAGGSGASYPEGVAFTVSFRADYGTDVEFGPGTRPRARDRNRIYFGPLLGAAFSTDSTTERCIIAPHLIADSMVAMQRLSLGHIGGGDEWVLQIWSRVNAALKLPTLVFVDDRPDYQRRRSDPAPAGRRYSAALSSV